jgi:hypothetical protein
LRKAHGARLRLGHQFMSRIAVGMHEHNGHGTKAIAEGGSQCGVEMRFIQRRHHLTLRTDTLANLRHALVQQLGQHNLAVKQPGPRLCGDAQRVFESRGDEQQRALAVALEQRIGRHRGTHLDPGYLLGADGLPRGELEQAANSLDCGIGILPRIFRQQLLGTQRPVGRAADDVGEGPAAVDPELPASVQALSWVRCMSKQICTA